MHFSDINAGIKNLRLNNDSLFGELSLKTKERSGFEVNIPVGRREDGPYHHDLHQPLYRNPLQQNRQCLLHGLCIFY